MIMINKVGFRSLKLVGSVSWFRFGLIKFPLPDLGEKIKEGTVKKLYVAEGDRVQQFQKIADVESDKQFTQITAPEMGVIAKIHYKQSEVCKVGDLFMQIESEQTHQTTPASNQQTNARLSPQQNKKQEALRHTESKGSNHDEQGVLASPVVKMYAKSNNVNIQQVIGSGRKNRILKQDIINFIESKNKPQEQQLSKQALKDATNSAFQTIKMNPFQKGMQKSMTEANKIPHLYYHEAMDVTQIDSMRQKFKQSGLKVTVMGILAKTFSLALNSHPKMNSTYNKNDGNQFEYTMHNNHNISLAIDTSNGLVVPNIKNVQNLSILQIQQELVELKKLSQSARLTRDHLEGGTICLSNIGTIAGISACPLILAPQVCIVAIGKVVEVPYYFGSVIGRRKFMTMSFGCDHRVVDGGTVAKFSNSWKSILENPYLALAKMR